VLAIAAQVDPAVTAAVVAQVQGDVLARSFLIAVVLVAPFGWWQWRRVRNRRRALAAAEAAAAASAGSTDEAAAPPGPPRLEDVMARIDEVAAELGDTDTAAVEVPEDLTVDGVAAPSAVVDTIVGDALARSGLAVANRTRGAAGTLLTVRRHPGPDHRDDHG